MSNIMNRLNIGEWDYYIFSDNTAIWHATNGLAAWFNGSGALLQGAAWLGALVLLTTILFGAAVRKSTFSAMTLGVWFFFMTTMGLTGQANIYNMYTGQVAVVQNVPALALVPASMFSKAGYKVFLSMDTAFQSVRGSYMSVSQYGFVGPLDVLISLRSPKVAMVSPGLMQTLGQVTKDCAINGSSTPPTSLGSALDALQWLKDNGSQTGLTFKFTDADRFNGELIGCGSAWEYLHEQFKNYINPPSPQSGVNKLINQVTTQKNPQNTQGLWSAPQLTDSYNMLIATANNVTQDATQFSINALTASTITYTLQCMYQTGFITTPDNCQTTSFVQADSIEKWKTEAAGAGSGFLKTMFTSMGVLQALFFALFPIIAIYGLVIPMKTATVFGGYVFFGIWCQSWLLVVAPLQAYIQTSIIEEMSKIMAGSKGMTLANTMDVYSALSTKLAVAADIMASAQLLSLALLSGSIYALSGLAQKWSGAQNFDSSKLQMDSVKHDALVNVASPVSTTMIPGQNGAMTLFNKSEGMGGYNLTSSAASASGQDYSQKIGADKTTDRTTTDNYSTGKEKVGSYSSTTERNQAITKQLSAIFEMSKDEAAAITKTASSMHEFGAQVSTQMAKALGIGLGAASKKLTGKNLSEQDNVKLGSQMSNLVGPAMQQSVTRAAAENPSFISDLYGNAGEERQIAAFEKAIDYATPIIAGGISLVGTPLAGAGSAVAMQAAKPVIKSAIMGAVKKGDVGSIKIDLKNASPSTTNQLASSFANGMNAAVKGAVGLKYDDAQKSSEGASAKTVDTSTATDATSTKQNWTDKFDRKEAEQRIESASTKFSETEGETWSKTNRRETASKDEVVLNRPNVVKWGEEGRGGLTGEQLMSNAATAKVMLENSPEYSQAEKRAAWSRVADATQGVNEISFKSKDSKVRGAELAEFEKNVLFERFLTGSSNMTFNGETVGMLAPAPVQPVKGGGSQPVQPTQVNQQPVQPVQPTQVNQQPVQPVQPTQINQQPVQPVQPTQVNQQPVQPVQDSQQIQPTEQASVPMQVTQPFIKMPTLSNNLSQQVTQGINTPIGEVSGMKQPLRPQSVTFETAQATVKAKAENDQNRVASASPSVQDTALAGEAKQHQADVDTGIKAVGVASVAANGLDGLTGLNPTKTNEVIIQQQEKETPKNPGRGRRGRKKP